MRNNTEDTSNTGLKRNKQKKELKKKDGIVRSEDIQGYRGEKNIDEILKFIGDKSSDSEKNKGSKTRNKIKSRNGKGSDNDCGIPKNGKIKMTYYNSVENVSTTVFQPMDSSNDESKLIKSSKKSKKKVPKQNQFSKKFESTEKRLDDLSSKSQNTKLVTNKQNINKQKSQNTKLVTNKQNINKQKSQNTKLVTNKQKINIQKSQNTKLVTNKQKINKQKSQNTKLVTNKQKINIQKSQNTKLVTNKQKINNQKSQNKLNATTSNFPPYDSYLLSQYTQPKSVKNKKRIKSTSLMTHFDKSENNSDLDSVLSLPASFTPSKQPSYKEAPKTDLTKPACIVTTSEESIPTVTAALPQRSVDSIKADVEIAKKTVILNKVPTAIPPQSTSFTVHVPPKKKQSSIMYNKYEVDTSPYFGIEIGQNLLCDSRNDYSSPVSIPMPIEYNYKEVILFIKQAWQDVEKEKINGRSNILEYKPE